MANGTRSMVHGNVSKSNENEYQKEAKQFVRNKLTNLAVNYATPFATRLVRDVTGHTSTREEGYTDLPPFMSKRQIWKAICQDAGHEPKWKDKCRSKMAQVSDWDLRDGFYRTQAEADQHEGGKVAKPIMSWRSFLRYWKAHFPKLRIRKSGEDTCTDCYKLRLRLSILTRKRDEALRALEDDDMLDSITPDELLKEIDGYDELIAECRKHVEMHQAQREDYNKLRDIAKEDFKNDVPFDLRTEFLVIDMSQNGALPMLRGDQMGDFYYMSPLIQLIFGVACPATNHMNVYIWEEGTADRGADNIISCLYHDLVSRNIIVESVDTPLKHLVIAADNCSGQNKNKAMLMFCMWLVEAGYVDEVTLLFLVKGHTKNDCVTTNSTR